jgi:hypothetical protein
MNKLYKGVALVFMSALLFGCATPLSKIEQEKIPTIDVLNSFPDSPTSTIPKRMREFWFTVSPEKAGVKPTPEFPVVFGVIMDWPVSSDVIATVIAVADGTSSVYTTRGPGIMGGYAAKTAAKAFVHQAENSLQHSVSTFSYPYPSAENVRFYIRTYDEVRVIEEKSSALMLGHSKHTLLFAAANKVMTELREAAKNAQNAEGAK